jgi:hypothetical protein
MAAVVGFSGHDVSADIVGLLRAVSYNVGIRRKVDQTISKRGGRASSIAVGIRAIGSAASMLNGSLCSVIQRGTSRRNDVWRQQRRRRQRQW